MTAPVDQPPPGSIIAVDDTPANLRVLSAMLKDCGHRVRAFPSGALALPAAARDPPDLFLLDIMMPEMDGMELCRRLKEQESLRSVPVIFISALNETVDKVKAFHAGAVDYVTKPFQLEEVAARVNAHMTLRRLQVALAARGDELQRSYDQLRQLEQLRDNLVHMIVHDMRSPLMVVNGYLELLKQLAAAKLNAQELRCLEDSAQSSALLVEMISSLLDVSRMEAREMPVNRTPCDLAGLAHDVVESLRGPAERQQLTVTPPAGAAPAVCDTNLIRRVIANLLGNAVKFTPKGGTITLTVTPATPAGWRVAVADSGPGVAPADQQRIFEKFGQVQARQEGHKYSTGLGLAFCKLAVEAHGGTSGLHSVEGQGSTFWFVLPPPPPTP